ncbi:MAG: protein phosphatase 2C domain-containing protein [Clostridia bacterium]|nr:protein phosphatase 2C domain-containing protein [Clostridia bacterium]
MKKLSANVCAVTHAGRVRKENEDNYSLNGRLTSNGDLKKGSAFVQKMTEPFHLVVCDGMGGESFGELASGIAVETLSKNAKEIYISGEDFSFAISNSLDEANEKICNEITARGARMGTTLAAIYAVKGSVICVNIGDTRIYHFSKGMLEQISFDHTHAQSIVDAGEAPQAKISSIPDAKRLTKHLGVFPEESNLSPNISIINDIDDGDVIMLCSDGLTDMLSDAEIADIISKGESAQDVSGKLVRKALENGGKDNVTVMTAFINAEETAVFTPIAEKMVGDKDADYEEEYRNSYGANQAAFDEDAVSPYANADARAYEDGNDKMKIIKILLIILAALLVLIGAAAVIKTVIDKKAASADASTTEAGTTYNYQNYIPTVPVSEISTWSLTTSEESTTEETTEETTRRRTYTTRRYTEKTTRRQSSTQKTTDAPATEAPTTPATEAPTTPATEAPTTPATEAPTTPATDAPTTPATRSPSDEDPESPRS